MKSKKSLLAQKFTREEAIKTFEAKSQNTTWTDRTDGSFTVSIPITATDLKQKAALRAKLIQTDALLGQRKSTAQKVSGVQIIKDPDLMTEQMLARRWHCSASRLQRWRAAKTGSSYLKIGGKVLDRQDDVRAYEAAHLVKTEPKT